MPCTQAVPLSAEPRLRSHRRAAFLLVAVLSKPAAGSDGAGIELDLTAPPECPTRDAILGAIQRLVKSAPREPLRVRARIERQPTDWSLELALADGERHLRGTTCVELAQTLVAIVSLAVDPGAEATGVAFPNDSDGPASAGNEGTASPPTSANAPDAVPQPQPRPAPALARADRQPAERDELAPSGSKTPPRWGASLLLFGATGTLPSPSIGLSILGRHRTGAFAAELAASGLLPRWAQAPDAPSTVGGDIGWFALQAMASWYPFSGVELGGYIGAEGGELVGRGAGVELPATAFSPWLAALAGAVARAPLGEPLSFEARLGLAIPIWRPDFGLDDYGAFFTPAQVSGRAGLGVAWR